MTGMVGKHGINVRFVTRNMEIGLLFISKASTGGLIFPKMNCGK